MNLASYAQAYRRNFVETAGRGQLILMLFDGALRFMNNALEGFEEPDPIRRIPTVNRYLVKTQAIIIELQASLNPEADPDFAQRMSSLYSYMRAQLRQANLRKDPAPVRIVVKLLGEIRDAWAEMLAKGQQHTPAL